MEENSTWVGLKTVLTLVILLGIALLFILIFGMYNTPAGNMGEISSINIAASIAYIVLWSGLSLLMGLKKYKSIFIGGLIYSILPYLGWLVALVILGFLRITSPINILIMLAFYLAVPVQGISFWMVFSQLPILLLGYGIGKACRSKYKLLKR